MFQLKADVAPTDHTRSEAAILKKLMMAQGVLYLPMLFMGQFWVLFQLLTIVPGWLSISNKLVFSPRLMMMYFLTCVFGVVFLGVDSLTNLSMIFSTPPPELEPPVTKPSTATLAFSGLYLAAALAVSIECGRRAWGLIKEMHDLPLASEPMSLLPLEGNTYASQLFSNNNEGTTLFQGQGRTINEP
eukprot:Protomagalhaensia_sp_Gyna_25__3496@NODE_3142_length_712_cov_375_234770_g2628_i0_p1_GENE_NODE_3142_length_712_cov_375_234770_g2628_i0NODE_3142_length_712_cov_375_234770_g2628_i0_p1_ORF_typecomplete_len187_score20_07_NODE_3142_length_712_cov_375_234770_g2628_i061621